MFSVIINKGFNSVYKGIRKLINIQKLRFSVRGGIRVYSTCFVLENFTDQPFEKIDNGIGLWERISKTKKSRLKKVEMNMEWPAIFLALIIIY